MRNRIIIIMLFIFTHNIYASGIPVVDIVGITQTITEGIARANEFKQTYDAAKKRLKAMKDQRDHYADMVEGHFNFEDIINDPSLNDYMIKDDWKNVYTSDAEIVSLREEFSMTSTDPRIQEVYDNELMDYNIKQKIYESTVERNQRMQSLLNQFSSATTPAAKADIANAINFEQIQIQNDAQMIASLEDLNKKRQRYMKEQRAKETTRIIFNEGFPRSQH